MITLNTDINAVDYLRDLLAEVDAGTARIESAILEHAGIDSTLVKLTFVVADIAATGEPPC